MIGNNYHISRNKRFYQLTIFPDNTPVLKANASKACLTTFFSKYAKDLMKYKRGK